jgi:diadenosine tetraphosphate (Ap4A) HIT family hydrolase
MSSRFTLHPQLAADCFEVADLGLSKLLLMNDSRYLWCILVPMLGGLSDLHDLPQEHRKGLFDEIDILSAGIKALHNADKINVAALGNMVPQLHIHVIARTVGDAAWPGPVWGVGDAQPWDSHQLASRMAGLKGLFH